jgi:hypothetical protein
MPDTLLRIISFIVSTADYAEPELNYIVKATLKSDFPMDSLPAPPEVGNHAAHLRKRNFVLE